MSSKKPRKFLCCIFLVLFVVIPFGSVNYMKASIPSELHPANTIWIEPSSVTIANIGDKFNITVWLNVTQKSFAWQIKLYFNSTYLNATRLGYTNGNKSAFFTEFSPMPVTPMINNEEGYI
ncbi:MAG: hypothetical protein ACFFBD_08020, partial [Candidatus Hodarchaeota archaeon]